MSGNICSSRSGGRTQRLGQIQKGREAEKVTSINLPEAEKVTSINLPRPIGRGTKKAATAVRK
jgi:hypothetical protein